MAIQRAIPLELVRPDYQSPGGYRRDLWRRCLRVAAALLAGAVLVATAVGARAGVRGTVAGRLNNNDTVTLQGAE